MKSKILALGLAILMMCPMMISTAFADSPDSLGEIPDFMCDKQGEYTQDELAQMSEIFSTWSNDKLNAYISYLAEETEQQSATRASVPTGNGQAAWLAAAAIVEDAYPCVAALIESSVLGVNYSEVISVSSGDNSGLFQAKIKTTSQYSNYVKQLKAGTATNGKLMTFTASQNADLAYSLHSCTAYYTKSGSGNLTTYSWYIYDLYDFAWNEDYNSPFITMVNNAAYLSQQIGALKAISVYIYFSPVGTK